MARSSAPRCSQISWPVPTSVATAAKGMGRSSISMPPTSCSSEAFRRSPLMRLMPEKERSISAKTRRLVSERAKASIWSSLPAA